MTIEHLVTLRCDGVTGRCDEEIEASSVKEARQEAREKGWLHSGPLDLCPDCRVPSENDDGDEWGHDYDDYDDMGYSPEATTRRREQREADAAQRQAKLDARLAAGEPVCRRRDGRYCLKPVIAGAEQCHLHADPAVVEARNLGRTLGDVSDDEWSAHPAARLPHAAVIDAARRRAVWDRQQAELRAQRP